MAIIISQIKTTLNEDREVAFTHAIERLGIERASVVKMLLIKTSLDARKRNNVHFVHSVSIELDGGYGDEQKLVEALADSTVTLRQEPDLLLPVGTTPLEHRPVIAGFGPAGLFAGLLLARQGFKPIILERGADVETRVEAVNRFWKTGVLDTSTNVQFGEGGAGTFSDGKLTTRISDSRCGFILKTLHEHGAPEEILTKTKPHIGTDLLRGVVKSIREEIIRLGGTVHFNTMLTDISLRDGKLCAVQTSQGEIATQILILAIGHSARDTFEMLLNKGVFLESKPFSAGVRIEHLQADIDKGLYGDLAGHPMLPVGEYQLSYRSQNRAVYTFCMCPGGFVVPAASEENAVVINGMSEHARDQVNCNSALVVSVDQNDFGSHPLDGIRFQQQLERAAFQAGGGGYRAPMQTVGSFLRGKKDRIAGRIVPSYALGTTQCDLSTMMPPFMNAMLRTGLDVFERRIRGFSSNQAVLTGFETRTSSPVRITRGENMQAVGLTGIYPCAEGAGYAGGIVSSAVDGLRSAQAILAEYLPAVQ